jgi:hypothetical protein
VDDDLVVLDAVVKILTRAGYEKVDSARDGAEAWNALVHGSYDLIITDHKMPRVTGLELITKMRSEAMLQPVILVSGTMPTDELQRNPGLSIAAMLAKPFTSHELLTTMENLLPVIEIPSVMKKNQRLKTKELPIAPTHGQKHSPIRILLVDDNRDFRELQKDLLAAAGYEIQCAHDGAAGWEALQNENYDLVITDNQMPRMTGLEMIEKLYSAEMSIPVIMATGNLPNEEFARKPWLKPEGSLQRPYTNGELLDTVRNVLDPDDGQDDERESLLPKFL